VKAIVYRAYGGPEVLQTADLPIPEPGPGQILVRVCTSSVNPVDVKIASGKFRPIMRARFPQVPGFDIAGEVVRCGAGVSGFDPGARVHARLVDGAAGAAAEYTLATPDVTVTMPADMDFATAAGLPLAGMTALQGLRDQCDMPLHGASQRVLVIGASGGVGHLAVQIARAAGATVIGVCSGKNRELVESLGAHEVIDYRAADPYRDLAPCDIILDCVGEAPGPWLPRLLPGGRFASMAPVAAVFLRSVLNPITRKKVRAIFLRSTAADLRFLDELASAGKLRVVRDQRFPLDQLRTAWERSHAGRAVGKIIVDVATPT